MKKLLLLLLFFMCFSISSYSQELSKEVQEFLQQPLKVNKEVLDINNSLLRDYPMLFNKDNSHLFIKTPDLKSNDPLMDYFIFNKIFNDNYLDKVNQPRYNFNLKPNNQDNFYIFFGFDNPKITPYIIPKNN